MYDKATLALIPSGYRDGELFSVLPGNGDGDFNFTRSSTATRVNKDGLIETIPLHTPRLDYPLTNGAVGDCPHLLLEPSRTNVVPYSEQFEVPLWGKQEITVIGNAAISPDGTQTADKIIPTSVSSTHQIRYLSLISSQTCATSVFAKADGINTLEILDGSSAVNGASFNLSDGTFTNKGSGVGSMIYYGNGWYRCIVISTTTGFRIYCPTSLSNASGDGTSGVLLWGAQLEAGSYATSYIPTSGSAETRSADFCNLSGTSAEFNDSEGVLFAEIEALANDLTRRDISINDGTTSNRVVLRYDNSSNRLRVFVNGTSDSITVTGYTITDTLKIAYKYKVNDYAIWVNGTEAGTNTSSTDIPSGLDLLNFDQGNNTNNFYGKVKQLIYFNEALSDSELQTLTS